MVQLSHPYVTTGKTIALTIQTSVSKGMLLLCGSDGKESACKEEDLGSVPGLRRSPGREQLPTPVFLPGESYGQRSLAGQATVHGVAKSQTGLNDSHCHFHFI